RQTFVDRQYELSWPAELGERIRVQYERLLADGRRPLIVDAGANIGAASLWFARMFPDAIIAAVEPEPGNAAVLRRNIEGRPNIRLFEAAIGGEPGFVDIHAESLGWATQTERSAMGVPVVTIDQLCEQV